MSRKRNWCFTDFTKSDYAAVFNDDRNKIRYVGWGVEECPDTFRIHHQGWVQFSIAVSRLGAKKRLNLPRTHFEECKGTPSQNDEYCKKTGEHHFHSLGQWVCQGMRTDLEALQTLIKEGKTVDEISDIQLGSFLKFRQGIIALRTTYLKAASKPFRHVIVHLYAGRTGAGKSRYLYSKADFTIKGHQLAWWDKYDGEQILGIDEYSNDLKITQLLSLLDGYQMRLPIKGGFTYANWTTVFLTTNLLKLHEQASDAHRAALARRITNTFNCWADHQYIDPDDGTVKSTL